MELNLSMICTFLTLLHILGSVRVLEERDLRQEKVIAPLWLVKGFLYLVAVGNLLTLMTKSITMTFTYLIQRLMCGNVLLRLGILHLREIAILAPRGRTKSLLLVVKMDMTIISPMFISLIQELNTFGQLLTPRAGHVTVSLGRNIYVFGGFTDAQNLYDDLYVLDVETCVWSKVLTMGEGPSARFSSAGACLDPHKAGFLVFVGGCNKSLEALDDMFYLHTGLGYDARVDQCVGSMSLKKQLKLKCLEQSHTSSLYDNSLARINMDHQGRGNFGLNTGQFDQGKIMFHARVTETYPVGYSIETMIDGKVLRGVLFSTKQSSVLATDQSFSRKRPAMSNGDQANTSKMPRTLSKDQTGATEAKDPPSNGVEGGIGLINPLDVNINTAAVAPQLEMGTVNAAPSSVAQTDEASLESRNAVSIDVEATKTGPGES